MESIEQYVRAAQQRKEALVRDRGVGEDLEPQVMLFRGGRFFATAFVGAQTRERWLRNIEAAVSLSGADAVVHATEAFIYVSAPGDDVDPEEYERLYEHGDLRVEFAAGNPKVRECLVVSVFHRGQPQQITTLPYHYEGRRVVWEPDLERPDDVRGAITDVVTAGLENAGRLSVDGGPTAEMFGGAMAVLEIPAIIVSPVAYPRNEPCPCGSGRKFKRCCGSAQ